MRFETPRFARLLSMRPAVCELYSLNNVFALPENIASFSACEISSAFDRRERVGDQRAALLGVERRVGGEQALVGAEEGMPAARRRHLAERGVGIEHLEIVDRRLLQAGLLGDRVALRRAEENLAEAELNLAGKYGIMPPMWWLMIFSVGSSSNRPE